MGAGRRAVATHPAAGSCILAVTCASPPRACGQWPGCASSARHPRCLCSCRYPWWLWCSAARGRRRWATSGAGQWASTRLSASRAGRVCEGRWAWERGSEMAAQGLGALDRWSCGEACVGESDTQLLSKGALQRGQAARGDGRQRGGRRRRRRGQAGRRKAEGLVNDGRGGCMVGRVQSSS